MNELYWITRCDAIGILGMIFLVLSSIACIILIIAYTTSSSEKDTTGVKICTKLLKVFVPIMSICTLIEVFVPTTKEALFIYGVGGTIDYLKENPTAKQLPDKCINALDKWVDNLNKENTEENKK
jgi:hypothetical protein